jgi:hypothetical protein
MQGIFTESHHAYGMGIGADAAKEGMANGRSNPASYDLKDILFAFTMLVCGFLYWNLITFGSMGAGVTVFTVTFCLAAGIYLHLSGLKQTKETAGCFAVVLAMATAFMIFDNMFVKGLDFMFLSIAAVYWICLTAGSRIDDRISAYIVGDLLNQFIILPCLNFPSCFGGIRQLVVKNQRGKGLLYGIIGILIMLPILGLVGGLLSDADAAFENLMNNIRFSISEDAVLYIVQAVCGLPVACYLYGLIYGNRYGRRNGCITLTSADKTTAALKFVPGITAVTALAALNILFAVFFLSQLSYLFSAFGNRLPELMTYADYARRGFFELSAVAAINLAVICAVQVFASKEKGKIIKLEISVLCVFTIVLIATALSKMAMYIESYGLTQLRVYTTWFMMVLLALFTVIFIRQFKKFNGTKAAAVCFTVLFMMLSFGNVDGMIAKYNIERYTEGTLAALDVEALDRLSGAAAPYLRELYLTTKDQELKYRLRDVLRGQHDGYMDDPARETFRQFNLQKYQADQIRNSI